MSLGTCVQFLSHLDLSPLLGLICSYAIRSRREDGDARGDAQELAAQPAASLEPAPAPAPHSPNKTAGAVSPILKDFLTLQKDLVPGGSVSTSSILSENPFLKPFGGAGGAGGPSGGSLWGESPANSSGLFRSLATKNFFPTSAAANPFFPVAGKQDDKNTNDDEESAGDVEREVITTSDASVSVAVAVAVSAFVAVAVAVFLSLSLRAMYLSLSLSMHLSLSVHLSLFLSSSLSRHPPVHLLRPFLPHLTLSHPSFTRTFSSLFFVQ